MFELDEEHVVAQRLLGGARLDERKVDARVGELRKDHVQRASAVLAQKQRDRSLVAVAREHRLVPLAPNEREEGLVAEMVFDLAFADHRAVRLRRKLVCDAGHVDIGGGHARAVGGGRRDDGSAARQSFGQKAPALRKALRMGSHAGDVFQARIGVAHQAMVDVHNLFAQNDSRAFESEVVERGSHRSFKRVFFRHHAVFALAAVNAVEHLVERRALNVFRVLKPQTRSERPRGFVGIGSHRPQEGECGCVRCHGLRPFMSGACVFGRTNLNYIAMRFPGFPT